jgi:hypothetical protein
VSERLVGPPKRVRAADEPALAVNNEGVQRFQTDGQQGVAQSIPPAQYAQQPYPARSSSTHRLSAHLDQAQSYPPQQPGPPPADQGRHGAYQQQPQSPPPVTEPTKKSFRSRIAANFTGHGKDEDSGKQSSKNGVNRRTSVRKSDPRLEQQLHEEQRLHPSQQWHQGSSPHLPVSAEQDEDNLDPFLQHESHQPQVPPKDYPQHPQQQQFAGNAQQQQQQQQYRPALDRVSTEGSYRTQGGVSQYSPDHHQGQGLQSQQQQQSAQQYQSYQPNNPPAQNQGEYQAFHPQNVPSPLLSDSQLNAAPQSQPVYYQPQQEQSPQRAKGPSLQDHHSQQNSQYQQQQFVPPPQPQPHPSQEFQQHQAGRASSQQPPELQHPQAIRQPLQLAQGQQQTDPQQLRPPSSHQLGPPSPLQQQPYKTYDGQPGQQSQTQPSDAKPANPSPSQQGQDSMPPSTSSGRNTVRKVVDGQQPGAPTREASILQQPSGQGQPLGHPPVSPGLATFDANVVPTASQGQPYRGEKGQQAQQTQSGEMGRATPPPRSSATDMSDEEIEKMMKEHEVLRE